MNFYEEQNGFSGERNSETVYHTGNGFYSPYVEPLWKKEKRLIRGSGNGIGMAVLFYIALSRLAGFFYSAFVQLIFPAANIHGLLYVTETVEWTFQLLMYVFSLLIPFGIYALCIKMPLNVALPFRKSKAGLTFGGVLVGLGVGILASYATAFLQLGLETVGIGVTMPQYETPETVPGIVLYIVSLVVAPAFIEEILFRGIIMQSLRRFGDIFALVSSSLIFGFLHLNFIQMPYAFIFGLCIGYFVMRTGSLWVGVIIHFINNTVAVVFEFLYPYLSEEAYYMVNAVYNLVCVILSVIAIIALLIKYKDMFRFEPSKSVLAPGKRTLYFLTSPALMFAASAVLALTFTYVHFL